MTVLVSIDTETREIRRYDSRLPCRNTHAGGLTPGVIPHEQIAAFRERPPINCMTEGYKLWLQSGRPEW
jgi:hypothetical protein